MPSITIRNLDKEFVAKLRKRAVSHGRSMEEEARVIVEMSLAPKKRQSMADAFREWFGPKHGVDLELPERQPIGEPPAILWRVAAREPRPLAPAHKGRGNGSRRRRDARTP